MSQALHEKAMLVTLSISQWTARKYDKKVSAEVAQNHQCSTNAGRYNKVLIAQEKIKKISKITNEARTFHYQNTLPWGDNGERILPSANFQTYTAEMRNREIDFQNEVIAFCANYPYLINDAKYQLNGMFNAADYPETSKIQSKYSFTIQVNPIPIARDFRVDLQSAEISRIKTEIETRLQDSTQMAMKDLWTRLSDALRHMVDRLSNQDTVFRNSLIDNLIELCSLLPKLNITNDPNLEVVRQEIESKLCSKNPQVLREDGKERKETAETAQNILDVMSGYMGA